MKSKHATVLIVAITLVLGAGSGFQETARAQASSAADPLEQRIANAQKFVRSKVKAPLNLYMNDALVSLAMSAPEAFDAGSPLLKQLNAANYDEAADAFLLYDGELNSKTGKVDHPADLKLRRQAERHLFKTGEYLNPQQAAKKFKQP